MDTLVIVRKIREAEALADSGKHGDARKLLEPLLTRGDLSDSHKSLVAKKIEVFNKQHERATRVLSRRASEATSQRDPNDDTDPGSGRKPALTSGDTTVERPALAPGAPTEAVPRLRNPADKDTTKLRKRPEPDKPKGDTTLADRDLVSIYDQGQSVAEQPRGATTVKDRPAPTGKRESERRQIAARPSERSPTVKNGATNQVDTEVPARAASNRRMPVQAVDIRQPAVTDLAPLTPAPSEIVDEPLPPGAPTEAMPKPSFLRKSAESQDLAPVGDDKFESDELPSLSEIPQAPGERGQFKALPAPAAPSVRVQDSYIAPTTEFSPAPPANQKSGRTSKDLTSMVERLPDDDLRKELALEVVRLREELEKAKSGRRDTDRTGSAGSSRRIAPGEKPESSIFKIPSNRVNTIVRTAAGTSDITAHMPTRDENVPELEVMRRDNIKKRPENENPQPSRVSLAQDYIENSRAREPDRLKFLATALGLLVIAGLVAWAIYWAITIVSSHQAH